MIGTDMNIRMLHVIVVAVALWPLTADAQRLTIRYTPAPGVPTPRFGIEQRPGQPTYFVNSSHPRATDTDNPQGSPDQPRRTIPARLPAGAVVEVRGGPYDVARSTWETPGTEAEPIFISGVGDPVIRGRELFFAGRYTIVEGFIFDGVPLLMPPGTVNFALRQSIVRNWSPSGHSAAIVPMGSNIVIFGNEIHNNGDPTIDREIDIHGIKSPAGAERIWILNNHIHHNGGDGIQMGNAASAEPWPRFIYIARNAIHEDRENAIDIKKARDVIISSNIVYGYEARSSSAGEAIVTHDGAERVWVVNNGVGNSRMGIVCTGANGYVVAGNVINAIEHHPNDRQYNPDNLFRAAAILTYNTSNSAHVNNSIWNSDAGISYAGGTAATTIINNLVGNLRQAAHHIGIGNSTAARSSTVRGNLIVGDARVRLGGGVTGCPDRDVCFTTNSPGMIDPPRNMRLQKSSPAIDAGVETELYSLFQQLYGTSLNTDFWGIPRRQGRGIDIGAAEFAEGSPPAPKKPRIVP
jgi:hypothetical protein